MTTTEITTSESEAPMRERQLASSVRQGRKITIFIADEYPLTGYLCGWDKDTYFLITPSNDKGQTEPAKLLIPKRAIIMIELHDERTFMEEPDFDKMVGVVQPFKDSINKQFFVNTSFVPKKV